MDFDVYLRFLLALTFVLGLIAALAWAARRFGYGGLTPRRTRNARLSIIETLMLDGKRRLVLVRRDDREHLLILGPTGETVVETTITALNGASSSGPSAGPSMSAEGRPS